MGHLIVFLLLLSGHLSSDVVSAEHSMPSLWGHALHAFLLRATMTHRAPYTGPYHDKANRGGTFPFVECFCLMESYQDSHGRTTDTHPCVLSTHWAKYNAECSTPNSALLWRPRVPSWLHSPANGLPLGLQPLWQPVDSWKTTLATLSGMHRLAQTPQGMQFKPRQLTGEGRDGGWLCLSYSSVWGAGVRWGHGRREA